MEAAPKNNESLKKRHFARLHERIQNKYDEMQRKLEKSKSVDSLSSLKEDYVYTEQRYATSINDISEINEMKNELPLEQKHVKHNIIIEEIHRNDAASEYYTVRQASVSEPEFTPNEKNEPDNDSDSNKFFGEDFCKISLESLNEVAKESDECQTPEPPPTISIRNKIGSRISAVKEKRRQTEKERNATRTKDEKKTSKEKVQKFIFSNTTKQDVLKSFKRTKLATVTIALIEATGLETDILDERTRLLFCRFRLGTEKFKSKVIKSHSTKVKWQELINFNLYEDNIVEVTLWDKSICIGRSQIDLSEIEKERTHKLRINLDSEVGNVQIFMLLTISGFSLLSLDDYQETERQLATISQKSSWYNFKNQPADVGFLSVIVYGAKGLSSHECYCVVELDNERLQTHTESKTNDPNWMKVFNFEVTDVSSVLDFTIYDEKKSEIVGCFSIPLLKIENGKKKWYALKDSSLRERAKGHNPRILLEMKLIWNLIKASVRVINPKEVKYLVPQERLDRHTFSRNLARAKVVLAWVLDTFRIVKTCFEWESRKMNTIALSIWLPFCWFFKMWMLPLLVLIPFIWYRPPKYFLLSWKDYLFRRFQLQVEVKKEKEEKNQSLRQKINSLQEMVQSVQNFLGKFANLGESVKNLFNFTVPFLSLLAIFIFLVIALVMFLIPTKYIFMIWGIHKFTRKILRPNRIANNEALDLLSRVPNDEILLNWEELPLEELPEEDEIK